VKQEIVASLKETADGLEQVFDKKLKKNEELLVRLNIKN